MALKQSMKRQTAPAHRHVCFREETDPFPYPSLAILRAPKRPPVSPLHATGSQFPSGFLARLPPPPCWHHKKFSKAVFKELLEIVTHTRDNCEEVPVGEQGVKNYTSNSTYSVSTFLGRPFKMLCLIKSDKTRCPLHFACIEEHKEKLSF